MGLDLLLRHERLEGRRQGTTRVNKLITILAGLNRFDDITRSAADPAYQKKLFKEFGI